MISTNLLRPSQPRTLGELRQLMAHLPDSTGLCIEECTNTDFPAPGMWLSDELNALVITEISEV